MKNYIRVSERLCSQKFQHTNSSFFVVVVGVVLSSLFNGGGLHSTMLSAVNPGLRPQTTEIQICGCLNYWISKTNNKPAFDRDAAGEQTTSGFIAIL